MTTDKPGYVCTCGATNFEFNVRCWGYLRVTLDGSGQQVESDHDDMRYAADPKTVTCAGCGRRIDRALLTPDPKPSTGGDR